MIDLFIHIIFRTTKTLRVVCNSLKMC